MCTAHSVLQTFLVLSKRESRVRTLGVLWKNGIEKMIEKDGKVVRKVVDLRKKVMYNREY